MLGVKCLFVEENCLKSNSHSSECNLAVTLMGICRMSTILGLNVVVFNALAWAACKTRFDTLSFKFVQACRAHPIVFYNG